MKPKQTDIIYKNSGSKFPGKREFARLQVFELIKTTIISNRERVKEFKFLAERTEMENIFLKKAERILKEHLRA